MRNAYSRPKCNHSYQHACSFTRATTVIVRQGNASTTQKNQHNLKCNNDIRQFRLLSSTMASETPTDRISKGDVVRSDCISVNDYWYDLPASRIAKYPVSPRDSSRLCVPLPGVACRAPLHSHVRQQCLLRLCSGSEATDDRGSHDTSNQITFPQYADLIFRDLVQILPADVHLIHNQSKVVAARLYVYTCGKEVEAMLLNVETNGSNTCAASESLQASAAGQTWRCMLRDATVSSGQILRVVSTKHTASNAPMEVELMVRLRHLNLEPCVI